MTTPTPGRTGTSLPIGTPIAHRALTEAQVTRAFSLSVAMSAIRCSLTYVVFPWLLPALGIAGRVGPLVGLLIAMVAIGFNVASIQRFWRADHRWKVPVSTLNVGVITLLVVLVTADVVRLWD